MMKILKLTLILTFATYFSGSSQIISQWRGENRDGIYKETGLLKQWPAEGPKMLWFNDQLPKGYSSPAVDEKALFITGIIDTLDYLLALDFKGEILWKTPIGKAWMASFSDSKSTPAIDGDKLYVISDHGELSCVNKNTGEIIWQVDAEKIYGGKTGSWGVCESPLVFNDMVFYTPAGDKTTMVAFNKETGKEIWKTETLNDFTGYVSPILIQENGMNVVVNVLGNYVFGVNADNGKILFKAPYSEIGSEASLKVGDWASIINTNSPLYKDHELYVTSGYDHSGIKFKLSDDFSKIETVWIDSVLDVHHGGVVLVDNHIYGSNWIDNRRGNWCCVNWETGKATYEAEWNTKGSIIYADGMLYCYDEKKGNIALVEATSEAFKIISEFKVPYGKGPHWSHLVIKDKKLYVRHEDALMVYDIAK
ncbi:MAG: PQQ-binding-like beta-propeller repeat protein [Salinivirgaceae bacterium]|nr:PQQ-binding-like beta-propeller repeat protein [Salinivirgaceae bacterium]